jgi:protein MAK11
VFIGENRRTKGTLAVALMKLVVAVGSYERIIYGLDVELASSEDGELRVAESKVAFALPAHNTGYVKCIASCPRYLVTGGTDEVMRVFDLKKRKDIGSVNRHDGSLKALDFFGSSHLLSAADDGIVALFRCKDWECLHILQKHKKPIQDMKVHPSGKLAIAIDSEKNLALWNLVTGKLAHNVKVPALGKLDKLAWSQSGAYYGLLGEGHLLVFETQTARKVIDLKAATLSSKKIRAEKWLALAIWQDQGVFFAGEGGLLHYISFEEPGKRFALETGHKPRIRTICVVNEAEASVLVTTSSDGIIQIFAVSALLKAMVVHTKDSHPTVESLLRHKSDLRITCSTVTIQ